ncbi:MAG: HDIG domain-containing protein [Pyrinomonadaceae bacterium]|nr:HDIG domain-containing protein [Pyrinomonadaceae bacterium]
MSSQRRPRLVSPFARARNAAVEFLTRPFKWFSPPTRLIIIFIFFVLVTTLLVGNPFSRAFTENYKEGDVVRSTIFAPTDVAGVDTTETERRRREAMETARPVFTYDSGRTDRAVQSFRAEWESLKRQAAASRRFDDNDLETLTSLLRDVNSAYIYEDKDERRLKPEILLVDIQNPTTRNVISLQQTRTMSLSAAHQNLRSRLNELSDRSAEQRAAIATALLAQVKPNVMYDEAATQIERDAAAAKAVPAAISLKSGQVIAREGDTVTQHVLSQLAAIRPYGRSERPWRRLMGLLFLIAALFWVVWEFVDHRSTAISLGLSKRRAFALVGSAVIVQTTLLRIGFALADFTAASRINAPFDDPMLWSFAIPFASAALLVALLADTQLALITGLFTALCAGLIAPNGMSIAFYAVISSSAAIYGIGRYRERQSVTLAGLFVGMVNALMAIALMAYAQKAWSLNTMLLAVGCGIGGGLLTTVFTAGGVPVNESFFGILTDVKLLELSNADLPVLGQLALRAPGTNQHSHAVGQLAEEACRAVGANPLLARIGALYHDIGKTAAPEYFIENQIGENPHDHLRPPQSAKIITSHVTYGLKLAKEIGLPTRIADFIPQHHGTRTLHFFLRKAQAEAAEGEEVDETDFRYPGPKPQFKEAAIMMLADSCEAAARSLARPDPENIRSIVTKIVDAIVSDGQLDECDLTLRELTTLKESMITSLTAIYHARIDYPGFNPPSSSTLSLAELDKEERGVSYSKPSEIPISKGGEVEDEAIPHKAGKH